MSTGALVIGGAGFIGSHLVEALIDDGCRVRIFDRAGTAAPPETTADQVEFQPGDFLTGVGLEEAVQGCDVVFHLVSTTQPKTSNDDPIADLEGNLIPTLRLLELARARGVRKVVFASSGGTIYGIPATIPVPETHTTMPICSYGIHKLAVERYLHLFQHLHGLDYSVLRIANAFGERQRPTASQGAIGTFLTLALKDQPITIWGDGEVIRDYVYARDVARAFCLAARHAGPPYVFNIGSGRGVSVNDLLSSIGRLLGRDVRRQYVSARPFDVPVNVLDITLAGAHLDWQPRFSFDEALAHTLDWLRHQAHHVTA